MSWRLSRYRTGDMVEVRNEKEILATLDENGCIDGMPFMPEMLQYCGHQFAVGAVAHKTCETAQRTWQGRKLETTVHLANLRCDGSAHGGCQADCRLYWRDEWLKPVGTSKPVQLARARRGIDAATLHAKTHQPSPPGSAVIRYSCQATQVPYATRLLKFWDPRQYLRDVLTGNHPLGDVARAIWLAAMRWWLRHTPRGYRVVRFMRTTVHGWLVGDEVPDVEGLIPSGQPTPVGNLGLKAGDRVRVKPKHEIVKTISAGNNKNRGLSFDQEMVRFCESEMTVRRSVTRVINEGTGEMLEMKQPCIILEGGVCAGQYSSCRLMCPRELPAFWRELWLERVEAQAPETVSQPVESLRDEPTPVSSGSAL